MHVLVKFECDYADEFNLYGFYIDTKAQYEDDVEFLKKNFNGPVEKYFGTNESIILETVGEVLRCFSVQEITDEEVEVFKRTFGKRYTTEIFFGNCWGPAEFVTD